MSLSATSSQNPVGLKVMEATRCPYPDCSKLFSSRYNLKQHINSHHLHIKPYKCTYCEKCFSYKHSMQHHQYAHELAQREQYSGTVEGLDLCKLLERSKDEDLCPYARSRVKRMKRRNRELGQFELLPLIGSEEQTAKLPEIDFSQSSNTL